MFEEIKNLLNSKKIRQLVEVQNIALYVFGIIVLAIAWSGAKTVQSNYELQKKISTLKQENGVLSLLNDTTDLQNKFYQTDQYLELSARQNLGLAAPGEQVLIVPKNVAEKYVNASLIKTDPDAQSTNIDSRPKYVKNLEGWRDFLLGRNSSNQ
jgi:cell division protein FtsB